MTRYFQKYIIVDYHRGVELETEDIVSYMEIPQDTPPYLQDAYTILKRWYRHALAQQPHPSREYLKKVSGDYAIIYQEYPSHMGRTVHTHIGTFQIEYGVPTEAEMEAEVLQMRRNRSGGHIHLWD